MTSDEAVAAAPSVAFDIVLRDDAGPVHDRILSGLRSERLLGVLASDEAAAALGEGFGSLLSDDEGRPLVVRDDGVAVGIDPEAVAARLHRRLDAAVQLSLGEDAPPVESAPQGFEPWVVLPEREEAAMRTSVRWVAVLPEPAEIAARWLTELASLVDGDVVLVPAGGRSLLVCDAWRFAAWPSQLRPLIGIAEIGSEIQLHAWLRGRIDGAGRSRRRLLPSAAPDWSVTWGLPPDGIMPPDGFTGVPPDRIASLERAQSSLIARLDVTVPDAVDAELGLGQRRAGFEALLGVDPPAMTTDRLVEALALPELVIPLTLGDADPAVLPGVRSASRQSVGRTLLGSMRDEAQHVDRSAEGLRIGVSVGSFLVIGLAVALLAGFGVLTREQTLDNPWFYASLFGVGILCASIGQAVAARAGRRRRRRAPLVEE